MTPEPDIAADDAALTYSISDAAKKLGFSDTHIRRHLKEMPVRWVRVGSKIRINKKDVDEIFERQS